MPRRPLQQDPKVRCTDDYQVAHLGGVERIVQPQALCNLPVGRIPQHELSSANQNGDFLHCHGEPIEELLRARVAIQVDVGVRMSVARQESSNPQRIRAMFRPGDDDVAEAVCDQFHSSQDEGAHQDAAEFGIALDQPPDVRMIELNDFAVSLARISAGRGGSRTCSPRRGTARIGEQRRALPLLPATGLFESLPVLTTKNGAWRCPSSTSTSSRRTARTRPSAVYAVDQDAVNTGKTCSYGELQRQQSLSRYLVMANGQKGR